MRLKELFSVPAGQKITEKCLWRVLVSSICSILLCMTCLVSTTWAWFTVSIENKENTITIATVTPIIDIEKDNASVSPAEGAVYNLNATGEYIIRIALDPQGWTSGDANSQKIPTVYVVMTVQKSGDASQCYYFEFTDREDAQSQRMTVIGGQVTVSFSVSWVKPANTAPAGGELVIGDAPATEPTTEPSVESFVPAPSVEETAAPEETNG